MEARLRASAVCVERGRLLCVRLRDPESQIVRLFPPGGAIEAGETPAQAAVRETLEETGYAVDAEEARCVTATYPYKWNGRSYRVTTHFVGARLRDPAAAPLPVHDAAYHEGVVWLALADVAQALSEGDAIRDAVTALLHA